MPARRFIFIGFTIALLEEFITQGVLKDNLAAWIVPTFIAFIPFLVIMLLVGNRLDRRMPPERASRWYYVVAGVLGLAVEWFLIGLTPWSDLSQPVLMLLLQLGMWSFWCSVAVSPRVLLDRSEATARVRRTYKRVLIGGFALIYFIAFTAKPEDRFALGIVSVVVVFVALNVVYRYYVRAQRPRVQAEVR